MLVLDTYFQLCTHGTNEGHLTRLTELTYKEGKMLILIIQFDANKINKFKCQDL